MEKTIIKVEGMSCEHCVETVTKCVTALPGIINVVVDLDAGTVTVEHDIAMTDVKKIKNEIEEQGYEIID